MTFEDGSTMVATDDQAQSAIDTDNANMDCCSGKDRSLRLYSKKHRVYVLREFILQTYGAAYLKPGVVILDVAGGKGDLSWLLYNVDDLHSVVVDPRRTINHIDKSVAFLRAHPEECRRRAVPGIATYQPIAALMPQLQAKDYVLKTPPHLRLFVDKELVETVKKVLACIEQCGRCECIEWDEYWTRASIRVAGFITPTGKNDFSIDAGEPTESTIADSTEALDWILRARLIVGFHPDQATDYCFQLAELLHIPVCVVPCCVFPSEFPHRRLESDTDDNDVASFRSVEKYNDLIDYLVQEHPTVRTATLDFPGTTTARRIVLYTLPPRLLQQTTGFDYSH
jgi:hypothetical protein